MSAGTLTELACKGVVIGIHSNLGGRLILKSAVPPMHGILEEFKRVTALFKNPLLLCKQIAAKCRQENFKKFSTISPRGNRPIRFFRTLRPNRQLIFDPWCSLLRA
jgi:hypothetical protein